ncbi:MAG: hypothetical protein KY476_00800 [Planctomycetes bacterium]|nr:hypothetical protein [Planctomycetota bacterium]
MKEELEGEWMLGTCGTSWKLSTPSGDIDSTEDEEADVEEAKILEGAKVAAFEAAVDSLLVSFDNQCSLHVVPTAREAQERDVPLWELFMPGNMFVEFHPGGIWSYKRSDLPAS